MFFLKKSRKNMSKKGDPSNTPYIDTYRDLIRNGSEIKNRTTSMSSVLSIVPHVRLIISVLTSLMTSPSSICLHSTLVVTDNNQTNQQKYII